MKKFLLLAMVFCFISGIYAQKTAEDLVVFPEMYEHFGQAQIDQYMQTDLAELIRLNYKMANYAGVAAKLADGDIQTLGNPEAYAKKGVVTDEDAIIAKGWINPFLYDFPQDEYKTNIFPLHHSGYYIIVAPKSEYDAHLNAQLRQFGF